MSMLLVVKTQPSHYRDVARTPADDVGAGGADGETYVHKRKRRGKNLGGRRNGLQDRGNGRGSGGGWCHSGRGAFCALAFPAGDLVAVLAVMPAFIAAVSRRRAAVESLPDGACFLPSRGNLALTPRESKTPT